MRFSVITRYELADHVPTAEGPALLLEGSWPAADAGQDGRTRWSLDDEIDGRFDWIDRLAADWAERLAAVAEHTSISPAYLNALALRYYLVKLIRVAVYFTEVRPLRGGDCLELTAATVRDRDYADVLAEYCRGAGVCCHVRWVGRDSQSPPVFPPNARWRRWAARLSRCLPAPPDRDDLRPRVVLCGNPRLLDPVCRELLARHCRLWWLYDRFALKSWLRWQAAGVRQLVCDSSLGQENRLRQPRPGHGPLGDFEYRGVDLSEPIRRWMAKQVAVRGPRQTRLLEQIDAHFRHVRPDAVLLDEDATPMARAVVAVGRRHGAASLVVQHGVPCCRFGFAPLAADRVLVWGRSSAERLIEWGVPPERIRITGSPQHDQWETKRLSKNRFTGAGAPSYAIGRGTRPDAAQEPRRRPQILLLATVPPRDDRPDAVSGHLTTRTNAEMLRMAFSAAAAIGRARLIVKLHPRTREDPVVRALQARFPSLRTRVVRRGALPTWLDGVDCALSCGSSSGVEATLAGVPVIQLAPPRATNTLPTDRWGFAGTARSEEELRELLHGILPDRPPIELAVKRPRTASGGSRRPSQQTSPSSSSYTPHPDAFAQFDRTATARVADEVLALVASSETTVPTHHDHRTREDLLAAGQARRPNECD